MSLVGWRPLGRKGYEAYAEQTGGRTFDGRQMPTWERLPERIQDAWAAAARAMWREQNERLARTYKAAVDARNAGAIVTLPLPPVDDGKEPTP